MCRLVAYLGEPIALDTVVCSPAHSLLRQSQHAAEACTVSHGDGFGIGWYADRPEPSVLRDVAPAWADDGLRSLCAGVKSHLFFAHVRASTGTAVMRQNCHPFRCGRWMFMHNGQIGGFERVRRALESMLPDALYAARAGSTDSELMFLLTLARIEAGEDAESALQATIEHTLAAMLREGVDQPLRFTALLTDGERVYATRYASDGASPTLYLGHNAHGRIIASEPLDGKSGAWQAIPSNGGVRLHLAPAETPSHLSPAQFATPDAKD